MAAGVTSHLWDVRVLVTVIEDWEKRRGLPE